MDSCSVWLNKKIVPANYYQLAAGFVRYREKKGVCVREREPNLTEYSHTCKYYKGCIIVVRVLPYKRFVVPVESFIYPWGILLLLCCVSFFFFYQRPLRFPVIIASKLAVSVTRSKHNAETIITIITICTRARPPPSFTRPKGECRLYRPKFVS